MTVTDRGRLVRNERQARKMRVEESDEGAPGREIVNTDMSCGVTKAGSFFGTFVS